jgi:hypothetical protein
MLILRAKKSIFQRRLAFKTIRLCCTHQILSIKIIFVKIRESHACMVVQGKLLSAIKRSKGKAHSSRPRTARTNQPINTKLGTLDKLVNITNPAKFGDGRMRGVVWTMG